MSDASLDNHLHRGCGGRYAAAAESVTVKVSGMAATVDRGFYRCSKCDDVQRTIEQREAAEQDAIAQLRERHALLAPREIRALREELGLTPTQLGDLLYGTPRGIVEGWEKGRYLQNQSVDAMLRGLRDRETLVLRAAKAGVVVPTPEELAAQKADAAARQAALRAARREQRAGVAVDEDAVADGEVEGDALQAADVEPVAVTP